MTRKVKSVAVTLILFKFLILPIRLETRYPNECRYHLNPKRSCEIVDMVAKYLDQRADFEGKYSSTRVRRQPGR